LIICTRVRIERGECKDKVWVVITTSTSALNRVPIRVTRDQLASGTVISILSNSRINNRVGINAFIFSSVTLISSMMVDRYLNQGILMSPLGRTVLPTLLTGVFAVERRDICLIIVQRTSTHRILKGKIATRRTIRHLTLEE